MKKQVTMWFIIVLVLNSLFAVAQVDGSGDSSSDCNWWCSEKFVGDDLI